MYLNKTFSFNEQPSRFIPIVYYFFLTLCQGFSILLFCYALLRKYDKIIQSDDNIQEISEQCQSKISIVLF